MDAFKKKIVIIDAHALIHRAYHAMPNLVSKKGIPTGALFGLTNMLIEMGIDLKPVEIVAAFDLPKPTFRHVAYEGYKSHRVKSDDALIDQIKLSPKVFEAFNIKTIFCEGYEADDIIGTLVASLKKYFKEHKISDTQIVIVSGDMDTMQLVEGEKTVVYTAKRDTGKGFFYNEEEVFKKYGIYPTQIQEYKGLAGDSSDNIPGIKGIGDKTAVTLLNKFGSLEKMYKEIKKVSKNLNDLNSEFSNLNSDLEKEEDAKKKKSIKEKIKSLKAEIDLIYKDFGVTERVFGLLKEGEDDAEFSKTLATIHTEAPVDFKEIFDLENMKSGNRKYDMCESETQVLSLCDEYELNSSKRKFISACSTKEVKTFDDEIDDFKLDKKLEKIEQPKEPVMLTVWDKQILDKAKIAVWLVDSNEVNVEQERISYLTKEMDGKKSLEVLEGQVKDLGLFSLYEEMELPIISILDRMRNVGIKIDREQMQETLKAFRAENEKREKKIFELAGVEFNVNSPKQLGEILFEKLKIGEVGGVNKFAKKNSKGNISTRAEVLEKLKDEHEIVALILEYREKEKLINTYLEPLLLHSSFDGRVHGTLVQAGSTTGRFSSTSPNLQNIPVRSGDGEAVRKCFIAEEGKTLLACDYSQIELRVAAMLSGDPYLVEVFNKGEDVHTLVASKMFNVEFSGVTKDMRRAAKAMNFGIIYGMGVTAIKEDLNVERAVAQEFYNSYTSTMSVLMKYLKDCVEKAKANGYTETLYKRRRKINELFSPLPFLRAQGERIAMNAPIQGSDADIIKWAMVDFDKVIEEKNWRGKVECILQIHDELLFEVDESLKDEAGAEIKRVMEEVLDKHSPLVTYVKIPITAQVKTGKSWGEM